MMRSGQRKRAARLRLGSRLPVLLAMALWAGPACRGQQRPPATRRKLSAKQLHHEERQHLLAVMPNFETTYNRNALPLTPKQKFALDFKTMRDPFEFSLAAIDAGYGQFTDQFPGYGQGVEGYAKRFGASYADSLDAYLWGSGILPVLLHEDPRYFRKGRGSVLNRALYAAAAPFWCRHDNRKWGFNYANVGGNFIAGGISNVYYPAGSRGAVLTAESGVTDLAEQIAITEFVEFWHGSHRKKRNR